MWKFGAAVLLLLARPALAETNATAYEALRVVGNHLGRDSVNHLIAVSGSRGNPEPETWKIMLEDARAHGGLREVEVSHGRVVSERTPVRAILGAGPITTIDTAKLNLDSSGAYTVARNTADKSHTPFSTASYTLRTDERGTPTWIVTLDSPQGGTVGTIHVNTNQGTVTRTEGLFGGGNMTPSDDNQRTDDLADEPNDEPDHGPFAGIKARFKRGFREAADDARQSFQKVRRSFGDFISGR